MTPVATPGSPTGTFSIPAGSGTFELELVLAPPPGILDFEVLDLPEDTSRVSVVFVGRARADRVPDLEHWDARDSGYDVRKGMLEWDAVSGVDAQGRGSIGVWKLDGFDGGELQAFEGSGQSCRASSGREPIAAPFVPGVRTLRLQPPGGLRVRVRDPDGEVQDDLWMSIRAGGRLRYDFSFDPESETHDVFGLPLGAGVLRIDNPWTDDEDEVPVEILAGETLELEHTLTEGDYEIAFEALVVDKDGQPTSEDVGLKYWVDDGIWNVADTDDEGVFRGWAKKGKVVTVRARFGPEGPGLEPAELSLPFGSRTARFRVASAPPLISFRVTAKDARTGDEIAALVAFDRGHEHWVQDGYIDASVRSSRTLTLRAHDDLRWRVAAIGYREVTGRVLDHVTIPAREHGYDILDGEIVAELTPGLSLDVLVVDGDVFRPLPGVRFRSEDAPDARGASTAQTGSDGTVHLEAERWSTYTVSCAGFEAIEVTPEELLDTWHGNALVLDSLASIEAWGNEDD